ncbi:MAG: AMP-binding protein [Acidimicrobiia bacterium]|nr:AMP-binding protein [Acidimicrobiia bacterium]
MLDRDLVLPHTIARRAEADPGRVCIQEVDGRTFTYGELHEAVLTWADALRRLGVGSEDTVATMFPNTADSFLAWLACGWLRAFEVPINTMYRGRMLEYILTNSRARTLVFAEEYLPQLADVAGALEHAERVVVPDLSGEPPDLPFPVLGPGDFLAGAAPAADLEGPAHHDVCCIIYTSGTTGPAKGVLMPWAELYTGFLGAVPEDSLVPEGAYYSALPTFHVGGKISVYLAAVRNARVVLREKFSLTEFWDDVHRYGCTTTGLIGMMAQLLLTLPARPDDADNPLHRIQTGPLFPEVDEFERRFGLDVFTGYGMTEIGAPTFMTSAQRRDWRSCGLVRPGYELRIVDEYDEEVPVGEVGELIVRTAEPWLLNSGYFANPEATARSWRNGWFHTGDGFRRDEEGFYYFVDRLKDAMRKKGENISSLEVEGYVREHPAVLEVAAVAAPSDFGHGEDEVKVVVVPAPGAELDPAELVAFLEPRMPRFMLPRFVEVVSELPKTQTQRIRKVELRTETLNERTWDRERGRDLTAEEAAGASG